MPMPKKVVTIIDNLKIVGTTQSTVDSTSLASSHLGTVIEQGTDDKEPAPAKEATADNSAAAASSGGGSSTGDSIEVTGCGIAGLDGRYTRAGSRDGVPAYARAGAVRGVPAALTVSRWSSETGTGAKVWRLTAATLCAGGEGSRLLACYDCLAPAFAARPPPRGWTATTAGDPFLPPGYEGADAGPAPTVTHEAVALGDGRDEARAGLRATRPGLR